MKAERSKWDNYNQQNMENVNNKIHMYNLSYNSWAQDWKTQPQIFFNMK